MKVISNVVHGIGNLLRVDRTIKRGAEDTFRRRRRLRIVVLGSKNSGKTVFLTALASNLLNHRNGNGFNLNEWEAFVEEGFAHSQKEEIADFPYSRYREGFAKENPEWPEKTTCAMSVLRLPLVFRKEGCKEKPLLMEFLDIPGERIADLTMAKKSYREWCRWMFEKFGSQYSANGSYLEYLENAKYCHTKEDLFNAYKNYLLAEYKKYSPWVVPSVVKLTKEGKATKFEQELHIRALGLTADDQFVPVPVEWFDSSNEWRDWTKDFASAYDKYKEAIVDPICDWLREADRLVYLVDVLNILKSGSAVYNQERKFGEAVLGLFSHHKSYTLGGAIWDYLSSMVKTRIKNAYLVVTKKDLAASETSENLRKLADALLGKELRGLMKGIGDKNIRTCAAVDTVCSRRNESGQEVAYAKTSQDKPETEYEQVYVPEDWPSGTDWKKAIEDGKFWFEDTYPQFDERENASPAQSGLDDLVMALLSSELE